MLLSKVDYSYSTTPTPERAVEEEFAFHTQERSKVKPFNCKSHGTKS